MIDNITGTTTAQQNTVTAGKATLGKDDFLKLMITQLKNQDPLSPSDSSQYAAQLAQFSSLEQLQNINTSLGTSINANYQLTQSINNTMTAALIGKEVKLSGNQIHYNNDTSISLGYNLPAEASSVTVKVMDKDGNIVKTIANGDKTSGDHKLSWDFSDNNNQKVPIGDYTFSVEANNLNGDAMTVDIAKFALISGVRFNANGTTLLIGKSEYNLSDVEEILNPSN